MQIEKSTLDTELDSLMEVERQARQLNDMDLSLSTAVKVFELLQRHGDAEKLVATVTTLCNKRGQFTKTVSELVQRCMKMVEEIPRQEEKIRFVSAIKDICEKKIYLEVEYARCAMILVKYNEKDGKNLVEAAKIIENVQVETYGSMSKFEKIEFILYQMKLNILLEDNTKLYIVSKKINQKFLDDAGFHTLKFTFNLYSFRYYLNAKDFSGASNCLEAAYDAFVLFAAGDEAKLDSLVNARFKNLLNRPALAESAVAFRAIADFSPEKLEKLAALKTKFEQVLVDKPYALALLDSFLSGEITNCEPQNYNARNLLAFSGAFDSDGSLLEKLRSALIAKNLAVAGKFYRAVRLSRLAVLFSADALAIEEELAQLIVDGKLEGKINRPEGIVRFARDKAEGQLDAWAANLNRLVELVDFVCERIEREEVVQSA